MKDLFKSEIALVKGELVKNLLLRALDNVHERFYKEGASSTGKYHPDYAAGEGGLLRHTQAVVYFTSIFCKYLSISQYEKDCIIAAAILHDTCKSGVKWDSEYSMHDHPMLVYKLLDVTSMNEIEVRAWKDVNNLIATHMGQWTTSNHSEVVLPKITIKSQAVLHWADYLASRKAINVNHFNLVSESLVFPNWEGKNSSIFSDEISLINDKDIRNLVIRAIDLEKYSEISYNDTMNQKSLVNKIKTSLFVANLLMSLETTFVDEHDKDILFASLMVSEFKDAFVIDDLEGIDLLYWYEIIGMCSSNRYSWERMIMQVCKDISADSTLEINFLKEEEKNFRPATDKQIYRLKVLIETIQKSENYDGRYDNIKPEKLSLAMAGKYISELKEIVG